ncbi:sialate O-acetylesterase [Pedobacter sp. SYSU D00535]|uniref:sialate O-acetylesterase n=1 Tax=Pedobacter sp. SYSU D00535 TaxID=2810308 RepID=UPI001A95EC0D|nr:sialate O-acetylesterase [Pedobacter sp. SYSU D00535]
MKYLIALFILFAQSSFADITLPAIISDNMVLQQNTKVRLWGWGIPGEKVYIRPSWTATIDSTVVTAEAKWSCLVQTPAAGGPYSIQLKGYNQIQLSNILIGEVWLCSGQSNMEMSLNWGMNYKEEEMGAGNRNIRFFQVMKATSPHPQEDLKASWQNSSPGVVRHFSAVACFFAKKLEEALKVPVGLINASWGGSAAEAWTPANVISSDSLLLSAAKKLSPNHYSSIRPGGHYNAMIAPFTNYNIAGVLWYQGETNVGQTSYAHLMKQLISAWRKEWNRDFPFYFAQIAPWAGYGNSISAPLLRESQGRIQELSGTGMVLTSDLVDDIKDIHPKMKKEVGERFANYALAETYGVKNIVYKFPEFKGMSIRKGRAVVFFANLRSGLVSKSGQVKEFYIAAADRVFQPAKAKIKGQMVEVWSDAVPQPVAVRYGFTSEAQADLFSKEGLPVNLFRTDNWDVPTLKGN